MRNVSRSLRRRRGVNARRLFIPADLLERMEIEARSWTPDETGGMLLGYRSDHRADADIVVRELIKAGPRATRAHNRFEPDGLWQQARLEEAYESSERLHTYLGDWHTHPHGDTRPSRADRRTFARIAAHRASGTKYPVLLIISLAPAGPQRGAYIISRHRIRSLAIIPMDSREVLQASSGDRAAGTIERWPACSKTAEMDH